MEHPEIVHPEWYPSASKKGPSPASSLGGQMGGWSAINVALLLVFVGTVAVYVIAAVLVYRRFRRRRRRRRREQEEVDVQETIEAAVAAALTQQAEETSAAVATALVELERVEGELGESAAAAINVSEEGGEGMV